MSDFETHPPGTARRIAELEADNERLQAKVEALEAVLMTESEKRDLLSKEHYRNKIAKLQAKVEALEGVLYRSGFVRCDIPACNCGSWHQTGGFAARFKEIDEATEDFWRNGETLLDRVKRIAATGQECPECNGMGYTVFNAYGAGEPQATTEFNCDACSGTGIAATEQEKSEPEHLPGCAGAANMAKPRSQQLIGPMCNCAERRRVAKKLQKWIASDEGQEALQKIATEQEGE